MNKWKILFVDSCAIVRIGLNQIISGNFDCEVLSVESTVSEVTRHVKSRVKFDLVIIGNIEEEVEELINEIRQFSDETGILIFAQNMHYAHAMNCLIAGANGFLTQRAPSNEIIRAIERVLSQNRYLCMELLEAMAQETFLNNVHRRKNPSARKRDMPSKSVHDRLSKRQKEIVDYLIKGETVSSIANHLDIKVSTVATHKSILFEKLGVKNVLELVEVYYGEMVV